MSRITPLQPDDAPSETRELLDRIRNAFGTIPNGTRVLARSSAALDGWWAFHSALAASDLSRKLREQLAVLTATHNGCGYCLSGHTAAARAVGVSPDDAAAAQQGEASDPHAAAVLEFGAAVLHDRGDVADAVIDAARRAGLSDADLLDIIAVIALTTFTNYYNRLAHTELDFPPVELSNAA
jgi:uncharacterized peroxidase-related enzyme